MAAIQFPASPVLDETVVRNGVAYTWNGSFWEGNVQNSEFDDRYVEKAGDDMSGNLTLGTDKIELDATDGSISAAGDITATDGTNSSKLSKAGASNFKRTGSGTVSFNGFSSSGSFGLAVTDDINISDSDKYKTYLYSDGSIAAANNIDVHTNNNTDTGCLLQKQGGVYSVRPDGSTNLVFSGGTTNGFSYTGNVVLNADGSGHFKGDVAVGDSSSAFRTIAAVIAALPESIRTRFADALATWETAGTLDLEDPTTLPADDELREAIIRATTAGKVNLNSDGNITVPFNGTYGFGTTNTALTLNYSDNTWVTGTFEINELDASGNKYTHLSIKGNGSTSEATFDGSITAAGLIQAGGDAEAGNAEGVQIYQTGTVKSAVAGAQGRALEVSQVGDGRNFGVIGSGDVYIGGDLSTASSATWDPNIELKASDGSITAAGNIKTKGELLVNNPNNDINFSIRNTDNRVNLVTQDVPIFARDAGDATGDGRSVLQVGYYDGALYTDTINLKSDGSITAAGRIKARDVRIGDDLPQLHAQIAFSNATAVSTYATYYAHNATAGGRLWYGASSASQTTVTSQIFEDGTINGKNVTFNLEPENEANYEVSTETYTETEYIEVPVVNKPGTGTADIQDGVSTADLVNEPETQTVAREVEKTREIRTYVGPTLSVRDELVALRDRAAAQDEVIAQLSARLAAMEGNGKSKAKK